MVLPNNSTPQLQRNGSPQPIFFRKPPERQCDRLQDNGATQTVRTASGQPAPQTNRSHVEELMAVLEQLQNRPETSGKLEKITAYIPREVKAELQRLADQGIGEKESLSLSAVIAAFLVTGVQHNVNLQYGALLKPTIEKVIREEMQGFKTHLAWLLVRVAYDTGQTKSLATNILNRQPDMTDDLFRTIVKESANAARANITRRTPQMAELIEAVERWIGGAETAPEPPQ